MARGERGGAGSPKPEQPAPSKVRRLHWRPAQAEARWPDPRRGGWASSHSSRRTRVTRSLARAASLRSNLVCSSSTVAIPRPPRLAALRHRSLEHGATTQALMLRSEAAAGQRLDRGQTRCAVADQESAQVNLQATTGGAGSKLHSNQGFPLELPPIAAPLPKLPMASASPSSPPTGVIS